MSDCETYRTLITEAVLDDLSAADESRLRDHLQRCADCRAVLSDSRRALTLYDEHAVPHPPETYWTEFSARLEKKISAEDATRGRPPVVERSRRQVAVRRWPLQVAVWRWPLQVVIRRWPLQVAAAVILFALGILVGRATVDRTQPDASVSRTAAVTDPALEQILTRAQTLFLTISKADPPAPEAAVSFAQVQAAERLLRDTRMLQSSFEESDDMMVANLIDDVELVLLQYSNAGTRRQARAVLDELGLLLRINLYLIDRNRTAVHL